MRSTFWPNRIFERQRFQNRQAGLKCSWKQENSALSMKIVQNAVFRSCAARFGQIAFLSVNVLKMVKLASNSLQNAKTVSFSLKLYKTLFSGHAEHVWLNRNVERQFLKIVKLAWNSCENGKTVPCPSFRLRAARFGLIAFWSVNVLKIVKLASNSLQNRKTVRFLWKLYKTLFSGHAEHVLAKSHFWASISQNRETGMKISSKRENCALFMNNVKDALFRSCAARLGQIAVLTVKVLKKVTLAWNSFKDRKKVHFSLKLYKTLFSGHAEHVLAKSQCWASISQNRETGLKFLRKRENSTLSIIQAMRSTFWPYRILERQSS